jgi:hypothetical protein
MPRLRSPGNRTIKKTLICGLFLIFVTLPVLPADESGTASVLNVDELRERYTTEAKSEIASFSLGDAEVSLSISGFWKASLQSSLGFSVTPIGTNAVSPDTPVLFTQEADLTLDLWLLDKWFVEASVLDNMDNYAFNTYRAGYQGFPGEIVRYAGIGNTGLNFPVFPYLDLGGDSSASFGFYGNFGGGPINFHALVRWDQAAREERTFVGGRERTFTYVPLQNSERGISFVLPDEKLDSDPYIYVEDEEGTLRDEQGRHWRLLGASEYAASKVLGLVELNKSYRGMIAVAYSNGGDQPWITSLDSYGSLSGTSFLGKVQKHFGPEIDLTGYPQCGALNIPLNSPLNKPGTRTINNVPVLVLYEPGTFSPFERRSRYAAPSSATEEAAIVRLPGLQRVSGYDLVSLNSFLTSADIPLYAELDITRGYYELVPDGGSANGSPESRWPLAPEYAGIYLPGISADADEINIRFTNYGSSGSYSIGTDVVPGSVQVWRSGILDSNFTFNASNGTVSLTSPAGFNEVIRITYLRQSSETKLGSIAAGIGAQYHKDGSPFSSEFAVGLRWNFNPGDTFTEEGISNPGTVGVSAKTAWDLNNFKADITAGLAFEQPDATGLYRIAGMEGNETVLELSAENSFVSYPPKSASSSTQFSGLDTANRANLVYKNYHDSSSLTNTLMSIDWAGFRIVPGENRPYPVRDPRLTGRTSVLAAEFSLDDSHIWTGFEVPLDNDTDILARAKEIEIPYRFHGFGVDPPPDFRVIVQIGSLAGKDYYFQENTALIYEQVLYPQTNNPPDNPSSFNEYARIARFTLNDTDRLKLGSADYMRIIVVHDDHDTIDGTVLAAPPIVRGAQFRPVIINNSVHDVSLSGPQVQTTEIRELGSDPYRLEATYSGIINRLHPDGRPQQVLHVEWDTLNTGDSAGADARIGSLPLTNYRVLSFFVKGPADKDNPSLGVPGGTGGSLRFIIAQGPRSLNKADERYIEAEIPLTRLKPGEWSKVSIRYQGEQQGVSVDDNAVPDARFTYRRQPSVAVTDLPPGRSMYTLVYISPLPGNQLSAGSFCIDEIILEEAAPLYRMNAGLMAEYKLPGTILAVKDFPILADLSLSAALEAEIDGDPFTANRETGGGVVSRLNAGITVLGAKITGNLAFNAAPEVFNWTAGHEISRSFGPVSVSEAFSASPSDDTLEHRLQIGLSTIFRARFDAEVYQDLGRQERKWNLALGLDPPVKPGAKQTFIPTIGIETSAMWTSKAEELSVSDYGRLWAQSWAPMVPDLGQGAAVRETKTAVIISEKTRPVGATLTLEGNTSFISNLESTRTGNLVRLEIPVETKSVLINFNMERGFKRQLFYAGYNVLDEGKKFGEGITDSAPLWLVFPFYSLFSRDLNAAFDKGLNESPSFKDAQYTSFNDIVGISGRFPAFYDLRAFLIPSGASARIERVLEQKMDTRLDILHLQGNIRFSAINMFGSFGYKPLFKFYQSDDYSSILETSVAIPSDEDVSYRVQWSVGAGFRGFTGGELGFYNTATIGSSGWLESMKIDWNVPRKNSLLSIIYNWIARGVRTQSSWLTLSALMDKPYEQLSKESLELTVDHSGDYLSWSLLMGHESIIRRVGQFNFSVFTKLQCTHSELTKNLSFIGIVGTTLNVMF